jgi:hypothetical protein
MSVPTTQDYPLLSGVHTTVQSAMDQHGVIMTEDRYTPGLILPAPGVIPQLADSAAPVCSVYYSTTQMALCFKDTSGTVNLITTTVP